MAPRKLQLLPDLQRFYGRQKLRPQRSQYWASTPPPRTNEGGWSRSRYPPRPQLAFLISVHIIFPAFTIGLAAWPAIKEHIPNMRSFKNERDRCSLNWA